MTSTVSLTPFGHTLPHVWRVQPTPAPWQAFIRFADLPHVVFLDSAAHDPVRGRYSFISACPIEVITARQRQVAVRRATSAALEAVRYSDAEMEDADPFRVVQHTLRRWPAAKIDGLPPFQGGLIGFFGYGLSRVLERVPQTKWDEFEVPDMVLGVYDWTLAFDHVSSECFLIAHGFPERDLDEQTRRAQNLADEIQARLQGPAPQEAGPHRPPGTALTPDALAPRWPLGAHTENGLLTNFSREDYLRAVEQGIEYIRAGDIFQVNLSQRLLYPARVPPVELYRRLRERNPAPFAGYFDAGEAILASSSPEQFLQLTDGLAVTRPIKGTRPRGYTPEADSVTAEALRESEKDRAENVMIVDLLRNDLSRVAEPGTVEVPRLFEIERLPTVWHLVSEVRGRLRAKFDAVDLLRAAFPGGSITGAPKVRAMEIIAELEPTARGPYCGSLAWIGFDGDMNSNILIRTMTLARGWLQFPVGGGVVALSRPAVEYQETLDKARGIVRALV